MAKYSLPTGGHTRYNRLLPGSSDGAFRGADFSSEASLVDPARLAFVRNMWRDYSSDNGGCVETSPGYRLCKRFTNGGKAHGLWDFRYNGVDYVICHQGTSLYAIRHDDRDSGETSGFTKVSSSVADADSQAFVYNGKFYLMDGTTYWMMNGVSTLTAVSSGTPYVPITYSDEEEYEQRNMLTDSFIERWNVVDVSKKIVDADYGVYMTLSGNTATIKAINTTRQVLYIPGSYTVDGVTYNVINIEQGAFKNNTRLKKVVIIGCNDIGANAFDGCTSLEDVVIHSFGSIGANAFANTDKLIEAWLGGDGKIAATAFGTVARPKTINVLFTRASETGITISGIAKTFNCSMYTGVAGDTISLKETYPEYDSYSIPSKNGTTYVGEPKEPISESGNWKVELLRPKSFIQINFRKSSATKYVAVTVVGADGSIFGENELTEGAGLTATSEDSACAADFYILDPCTSINKITLQGAITSGKEQAITVWYNHNTKLVSGATLDGANCEVYKDETDYYTRVRLYAKNPGLLSDVVIKLYGTAKAGEFSNVAGSANYADASGGYTGTSKAAINGCKVCTVFDGRPFFTGNSNLPNTVFYCCRRSDTGTIDPSYVGICSFFNDGTGNSRNNALLAAGSVLMVFKERSGVEGSIFYHTPRETGLDFLPKDYPAQEGASGYDCLGAAINFLDDYVFVTAEGLSAVDKQQLNLERTIGHRSSNVDRLLRAMDLSKAKLCEWEGYLVLSCEGEILLADSRKMHQNATGGVEYEWFRLTDIGYWSGQYRKWQTMTGGTVNGIPIDQYELLESGRFTGKLLQTSETAREVNGYTSGYFAQTGGSTSSTVVLYYDPNTMEAVTETEEYVGGYFCPARQVLTLNGVLYFSYDDAGICCFNTDKRGINFCTYATDTGGLYVREGEQMVTVSTLQNEELVQSDEVVDAYIYETGRGYRLWGQIPIKRENGAIYRLEMPLNPVSQYEMDSAWYTYCGRRYRSEMATRYDDCNAPYLSKCTIKDSLIVTAKSMTNSGFNLLVKTDREEWGAWKMIERNVASQAGFTDFYYDSTAPASEQQDDRSVWKIVEKVIASKADFTDLYFSAHSFRSRRLMIYKSKEREKKWVRKQYCLQSECYKTPFGIYNLGYGYTVHGKVRT